MLGKKFCLQPNGRDGSAIEAAPEPTNCHVTQNLTAAGGALALLLLACAALLAGDGVAGCGGSSHARSVAVIRAGAADAETGE